MTAIFIMFDKILSCESLVDRIGLGYCQKVSGLSPWHHQDTTVGPLSKNLTPSAPQSHADADFWAILLFCSVYVTNLIHLKLMIQPVRPLQALCFCGSLAGTLLLRACVTASLAFDWFRSVAVAVELWAGRLRGIYTQLFLSLQHSELCGLMWWRHQRRDAKQKNKQKQTTKKATTSTPG